MPPRNPESRLMAWIEEIEKPRTRRTLKPHIDLKVLSAAVKLVYYCGLKKGEIINLKVKDVRDIQGLILNEILAGEKNINGQTVKLLLSDTAKEILQDHFAYLKKRGYSLARNAPLFPTPGRTFYTDRKLGRHLDNINLPRLRFEKIRQAGIKYLFENLPDEDDKETRIAKVAKYARTSEKNISRLISG
jgi:integrase